MNAADDPLKQLKPDLEEAERRWLAFWEHELLDRPCCIMRAPRDGVAPAPQPAYMAGARGDQQAAAEQALAWGQSVYWGGEAIPCYTPSFGPDMFAAFLGSDLAFPAEGHGNSWALPCVGAWPEALPIELEPANYWWQRMLDFCGILATTFQGRMLVSHLDLHSNLDALLAMRGGMGLCTDLMDVPELIDRAMADVRRLYRAIDEGIRQAGKMTRATGWMPVYHPRRTNAVQCDFAALIGPHHFRRWALPALEEEAAYLGHCIMHYDGPQMLVHLDDVCALPGLDCIQWQPGAGNKPFIQWMDLLKEIQAKGAAVYVGCSLAELPVYHQELQPERVCYVCSAPSQAEADRALKWLADHT
ncbi:MAG: hypothetical protein ABIL09_06785 [Gemmatimonadota bacterium]